MCIKKVDAEKIFFDKLIGFLAHLNRQAQKVSL